MPPQVPFWDPAYEGETFTGPQDTGMRAQDFWYFLSHDGTDSEDEAPFVHVSVTPRRYTQESYAMWDQSMDLDYLFPPELDLSESMEGVWETEHPWHEVDARMRQAGFRPIPEHYLQRWAINPEQLQPPEPRLRPLVEPGEADLTEIEDQIRRDARRFGTATGLPLRPKPEPPIERKSAWERLLDDED